VEALNCQLESATNPVTKTRASKSPPNQRGVNANFHTYLG